MRALTVIGPVLLFSVVSAGCSQYIKRDEFDSTVSDLRSTDADLSSQLADMQGHFTEMTQQLHGKFAEYDASITQMQGRLRVEMTASFGFGDATLNERDKPALDEFSAVIREHHPGVLVTVEGFTDPAGDPAYNKWLGMERAKAVKSYLIEPGGLNPDKVRAVSYGEDSERLVKPGAWGESGAANRRVALVIDYAP
jgi:peptidoglycan-associated lipoprotein